jgi:endonuclease/exonuclease/phosphatase (EEP) superfamily protein YafD
MLDTPRPRPSRLAVLFAAAALLSVLPLGFGFLGHLHPALDSFSHFRLHLAALLILVGTLAGVLRMLALGIVTVATGMAAIWITLGGLGPAGPASVQADPVPQDIEQATYRLLHLNLRYDNATPERVLSMIGRVRPDILTLTEVSEMWEERLSHIAHAYPHRIVCPPPSRIGGVAILSRRPFADTEPQCHERGALAVADIDIGGRRLDVAALHLGWPWPFDQPYRAPRVASHLSALAETAIVAGDFNAAPWSWTVRRIAAEARLRMAGHVGPTWLLLGMPDPLRRHAGLPIDHVLVKGGVVTHSIRRLEDVGSDHLPVLHEFSLLPIEREQKVMRAELRQ